MGGDVVKKGQRTLLIGLYFSLVFLGLFGILFGTQVSSNAEPMDQMYIIELEDDPGVPLASGLTACEVCNPPG